MAAKVCVAVGAGTNRINIYVVRQATEGLAHVRLSKKVETRKNGVAIAYDSRVTSPEFAFESAAVLAQHGIKSYTFESAFVQLENYHAVRHLNCFAEVSFTARANPLLHLTVTRFTVKTVDKCPHTMRALSTYIRAKSKTHLQLVADVETEKASGLWLKLSAKLDIEYLLKVKDINTNTQPIEKNLIDMRIVYTHHLITGEMLARRALAQAGFDSVFKL